MRSDAGRPETAGWRAVRKYTSSAPVSTSHASRVSRRRSPGPRPTRVIDAISFESRNGAGTLPAPRQLACAVRISDFRRGDLAVVLPARSAWQHDSALRVLRRFAGALEAGLLALFSARVAGEI